MMDYAVKLCFQIQLALIHYGFQFDAYFNATMWPHYYDWVRWCKLKPVLKANRLSL